MTNGNRQGPSPRFPANLPLVRDPDARNPILLRRLDCCTVLAVGHELSSGNIQTGLELLL